MHTYTRTRARCCPQAELRALVTYAKDRGVRIIPELDVPAHTGGFRPLGHLVKYCDHNRSVLADHPQNIKVVQELLEELSAIFIDDVIHFGGDEVCKHGVCPTGCTFAQVHSFEKNVQRAITALGRVPMGWNDVFSDPKASPPNAALAGTILQNWGKQPLQTFAKSGFSSLDSEYTTMYLAQQVT